jgi:hypothetical protein
MNQDFVNLATALKEAGSDIATALYAIADSLQPSKAPSEALPPLSLSERGFFVSTPLALSGPLLEYGWICPHCGRSNAPWAQHCDCVPGSTTASSKGTHGK